MQNICQEGIKRWISFPRPVRQAIIDMRAGGRTFLAIVAAQARQRQQGGARRRITAAELALGVWQIRDRVRSFMESPRQDFTLSLLRDPSFAHHAVRHARDAASMAGQQSQFRPVSAEQWLAEWRTTRCGRIVR